MVLRRVSSGVRGNLHLFGGHLDKAGFISEIKSMLSEFFQYGITEEKLETLIGETKSPLLRRSFWICRFYTGHSRRIPRKK